MGRRPQRHEFVPIGNDELRRVRRSRPGGLSGATSLAQAGGSLFVADNAGSRVVRFSLDPANGDLNPINQIGTGRFSKEPGSFEHPPGVAAPNAGLFFGNVYVSDSTRVQVFSATGDLHSVIQLPRLFLGEQVDVREDGVIYVTGHSRTTGGVAVYSPGPLVELRARALGGPADRAVGKGHAETSPYCRAARAAHAGLPPPGAGADECAQPLPVRVARTARARLHLPGHLPRSARLPRGPCEPGRAAQRAALGAAELRRR
jgi:hypothetical protein